MTTINRPATAFSEREDSTDATHRLLNGLSGDGCTGVRFEVYDGTVIGPADATTVVRIVSPDFFHRVITGRGSELAFSRAYVAGDVEVYDDIYGVLRLVDRIGQAASMRGLVRDAASVLGIDSAGDLLKLRPLPDRPKNSSSVAGSTACAVMRKRSQRTTTSPTTSTASFSARQ